MINLLSEITDTPVTKWIFGKTNYEFAVVLPDSVTGFDFFLSDANKTINPMAGDNSSEQKKYPQKPNFRSVPKSAMIKLRTM
jgi:hypothetical protein